MNNNELFDCILKNAKQINDLYKENLWLLEQIKEMYGHIRSMKEDIEHLKRRNFTINPSDN